MAHSLTLELPEEAYSSLLDRAQRIGCAPEELASEWLAATIRRIAADPLLQLSGFIDSELTDVAERHDEYLGEALFQELRGREGD